MQHQNGPCGVLVAVQAWVIANLLDANKLNASCRPSEQDISQAICSILYKCKGKGSSISICTWENPSDANGVDTSVLELPVGEDGRDSEGLVTATVLGAIEQFQGPGGE